MVSHGPADVTAMENPAESFGECVRWVDRTRDVFQDDIALVLPLLDGKMLNRNVPGAGCRLSGIDHKNCGLGYPHTTRWVGVA